MGVLVQYFGCRTCGSTTVQPHGQLPPQCCGGTTRWIHTATYTPPAPRFGQAPVMDFTPSRDRYIPIEDGRGGQIRVDSLHDIRTLERESQRRAANGEGQEIRFRLYSNADRYTNSFGGSPAKTPTLTRGARQILDTASLSAEEADAPMGPGAVEDLASALPLDPQT